MDTVGEGALAVVRFTGEGARHAAGACAAIATGRIKFARAVEQVHQIGAMSLPIVTIALFFTGMVMALHVATALKAYGASLRLAEIVLVSMVRELSPIFTALLVCGRAGSGITAELGSMQLSEQLSAMRALSLDIVAELVAPRVLATVAATVFLTATGDLAGVLGGYLVAIQREQILFDTYHAETVKALAMTDVWCGLFKSALFGFGIATIGCTYGLRTRAGAGELGRNTKSAVVIASFCVLVGNYFLTELYGLLFER